MCSKIKVISLYSPMLSRCVHWLLMWYVFHAFMINTLSGLFLVFMMDTTVKIHNDVIVQMTT